MWIYENNLPHRNLQHDHRSVTDVVLFAEHHQDHESHTANHDDRDPAVEDNDTITDHDHHDEVNNLLSGGHILHRN